MTAANLMVREPINPDDKPKGSVYEGSKRPLYFTEQYLVVEDFKDEAYYHLGLSHRHNRCLHTPGVIAGLEVKVEKGVPAAGKTRVTVDKGIALDHFGREIILTESTVKEVDTPAGESFWVALIFKEEKSQDDISPVGKAREKRAVQAPEVRVITALPTGAKDPDDDPVIIYRWAKTAAGAAGQAVGAGARIPTGGALSFQPASVDPADTNPAPPMQAGLDFADDALRIRARVTDPVSLDTTHLVIQRATGNVGIGTISPDAKLTIQQGETNKKALSVSGDGGVSFYNQAGNRGIDFLADSIRAVGTDQSLTIAATGAGSLLLNPVGGNLGIRTGALNLANITDVKAEILRVARQYDGDDYKDKDKWRAQKAGTVLWAMDAEKNTPVPRLIIAGDVIILGRLLVAGNSEYGGQMCRREGIG